MNVSLKGEDPDQSDSVILSFSYGVLGDAHPLSMPISI